jgi:hypothetical protein
MSNDPQNPLIPAKAGTQMGGLRGGLGVLGALSNPHRRYSIWVPAFAGMSGGEI